MFELTRKQVVKEGKEYTDLYLNWSHEGKDYKIRVKPVFVHELKILLASAKEED